MKADADSLRRVVGRTAEYGVQPDPPRGLKFSNGKLSWEKPRSTKGLTHFNIYADTESNLVRRVPAGQLELQDNLTAARVFVTSFNATSNIESSPAVLQQSVGPGGGSIPYHGGWYVVPIITGTATPDPSQGFTQQIIVVGALNIELPTVISVAGDFMDLRIEQDATSGGFQPTFDAAYRLDQFAVVGVEKGTYSNIPMVYSGTFWGVRAGAVEGIFI